MNQKQCKMVCRFGVETGIFCCNNCSIEKECSNPCKQNVGNCNEDLEIDTGYDIKNSSINKDVEELTFKDYKTNLHDLSNLKFEKINFFNLKTDNMFDEVNGDTPKYVEFNDEKYPYEKALIKAINEIYNMFKDCSSYEEARKVINSMDVLSEDKGYCVAPNTTGKLYGCWVVLYGNHIEQTIHWDVRWY